MRGEDSRELAAEPVRRHWGRAVEAELLLELEAAIGLGSSERAFALEVGVPRSTLRHWQARKAGLDADPLLVYFFDHPVGQAFQHRVVLAAHYVFSQIGPCGIRMISTFLKLSGISCFVAASNGSTHQVSKTMTEAIIAFGKEERARLAPGMPTRSIAVAQDENFHEGVCLLAMEPASDFILLEELADNREADTWTAAMVRATADLPVRIVISGADECGALKRHIKVGLGAEHGPDLFHMQQDLWQAMEPALAASLQEPAKRLAAAEAVTASWRKRQRDFLLGKRDPGRPPQFARYIADAAVTEDAAQAVLQRATDRQAAAHQAIRSLSDIYHPVDLERGSIRGATALDDALGAVFAVLDQTADDIQLADKRRAKLDKARRLRPKMVSHLAFFWAHVDRCLGDLQLPSEAVALVKESLIPGLYLSQVARRAKAADARRRLAALAETLMARATDPGGALALIPAATRADLDELAREAVALFTRSTSCVEGRNGRLSLLHHGVHRLGPKRRQALTILHNFAIHRPDGSTPASRFFHQQHHDLFAYILDHLDLLARPRRRAGHQPPLTPAWTNL